MADLSIKFTPSNKKIILKIIDEDEVIATFNLRAKKTLDGNIIVYDHADIDIVLMPERSKITTYKKDAIPSSTAYGAADRLFKYLASKGLIDRESFQGGGLLDSFEAKIPQTSIETPYKLILLSISKWLEKERPYFEYTGDYLDQAEERLTDPDNSESTELGEIPQDDQKGSIVPGYYRSPYWMSYIL